ncbi:MAG: formate/nitrite transporter family protein [Pseudomonadota bacterium]
MNTQEPDMQPLDSDEMEKVEELKPVQSTVIFEAIRQEGEHELSRSAKALWWSGVAAGLAISTSVMAKGFLVAILPDAEWSKAVSSLGYTLGFLIVILARMQLFTENTITPVLQLFLSPTRKNFWLTGRLWLIVFCANLAGCFVAALFMATADLVPPKQFDGILEVSRAYASATAMEHFRWGILAGFLIAALVWILPRMEGAGEVLMIIIITYTISLGGFSHVVAGSTELFILVLLGELDLTQAFVGGIMPALFGNIVGGTCLFAAMTYAQLREELKS